MKLFLTILGVLILFLCFSQKKVPHSIKVTYVDCSIETIIGISCSRFDISFSKDEYHFYQVKNTSELVTFENSLKKFVKIKCNSIDVRGKIEFISQGHNYKYCFDQFGKFNDGVHCYKNIWLFKLIKQACPDYCR